VWVAGVVLAGLEGVAGAADPGTPDLPGEPLIPRFAASGVRLLGVDRVALFPDGLSAADPVEEMAVAKTVTAALHAAGPAARDGTLGDPFGASPTTGRDAGKPWAALLGGATDDDVVHLIAWWATQPGGAGDLRLVDGFARWVTAGRPTAGGAELALRRNRGPLSSLGPMPVNLQTGTINGTPLDLATASWASLYPAWDHTNARVSPTDAFDPGYGYTQFGNDLEYHPSTRGVQLRLTHRWYAGTTPFHGDDVLTTDDLTARLGAPQRTLGPADAPTAWLYARPYGTLAFHLDDQFGDPIVNFVHLYPVPTERVPAGQFPGENGMPEAPSAPTLPPPPAPTPVVFEPLTYDGLEW